MSSHRESRSPIPSTLFRPGTGARPPFLAGRAAGQRILAGAAEELDEKDDRGRANIPQDIVLYGPRGNGKTALTLWLQRPLARVALFPDQSGAVAAIPDCAVLRPSEPGDTANFGAPPASQPARRPLQLSIPGTRQERLKVWSLVSVTVTDSSPGSFGV